MRQAFFHNTASNLTRFHMASKWTQREVFFHPTFVPILKPLERSEIMFSHQKSVEKTFFI